MQGQQYVGRIIISFLVMEVLGFIVRFLILGPDRLLSLLARVAFAGYCAKKLYHGSGWARWFTGFSCAGAVVFDVVALTRLGSMGISVFSLFGLWLLIGTAFYTVLACLLFFSKRVSEHFAYTTGF